MEKSNLKIKILPSEFTKADGTFDMKKALERCGKIAGICYSKEGFEALENENIEDTNRRIRGTLNKGHHSIYDHVNISFDISNVPKIIAMIINNEKQYTTSEKSVRYTPIEEQDGSIITDKELELYNKWKNIFKLKIKERYGNVFSDDKIESLSQENARYLVTVFMQTNMIYTTTLRQINIISKMLEDYQKKCDFSTEYGGRIYYQIESFNNELKKLGVLEDRLMKNEKQRKLSLFGENIEKSKEHFSDIYQTKYEGTLAQLAQGQRHRTENYKMEFLDKKNINFGYYVPEIIRDDVYLTAVWLDDIRKVSIYIPQGTLVSILESGTYDNFILKCKERLCTCAQLEINNQTKETLEKYKKALIEDDYYLKDDIEKYTHGARCTFPDYTCNSDCKMLEGKKLIRKI